MNRKIHSIDTGDSDMARSYGARVDVAMNDRCLSLVVAREHSPKALIRGAGGTIAMELSPTTVLAVLPLQTHISFRNHPQLNFIGPVTLDQARYSQFISTLQQRGQPRVN